MAYPAATKGDSVSSQSGSPRVAPFAEQAGSDLTDIWQPARSWGRWHMPKHFLRQVGMPGAPFHVTNLVFMGMGEPLANYDRVREALCRIIEVMGMSARAITVSTVGMVPGIRRPGLGAVAGDLDLSLHAADDDIAATWSRSTGLNPLADVEAAAAHYFALKHRRISMNGR